MMMNLHDVSPFTVEYGKPLARLTLNLLQRKALRFWVFRYAFGKKRRSNFARNQTDETD